MLHMLCCVTFLPAMKMPPSPTFQQQSALVSDPNSSLLQSNTTTTTSSSCSRHGTRSRPSLSSKFVQRPKHGSSKSSGGGHSFSSLSIYDHINHLQDSSSSSNSPYYKGLLDQSLAIFDQIGGSCTSSARPDAPTPPPHPPQACYPISMITSLNLHLSSGHSPYYKGLTDYSLVIGTSCWSPAAAPLPIHHDDHHHQNTNPLSCHQSSPYYRGLIDYSLVLHDPHHLPPHPHSTNSQHSSASASAPAPATNGPDIVENLTLPTCTSSPLASTLNDLITTTMGDDDDNKNGSLTEEKKPLRYETVVSKEVVYDKSILQEKMEMELETKGAGADDGAGLVIEEAIMVESTVLAATAAAEVKEEDMNADKTSCLNMEMTKEDSVEFAFVEKPLRERVSDSDSDSEALEVKEDGNADQSTLEDQMELDIIQGKPLRERVSDSETETTRSLKEKPLLVSEQRVIVVASKEDIAEVYQYTWGAKHQPMTLDGFICNRDIALQLKALIREGCGCNHFIFEGPPNVGKRSMIRAMLRDVFGADRVQVIKECKDFNLKGEMVEKLQVQIQKSDHHVEVNLSETKGYEKHVIVELFKETYGKIINNSLPCSPENCQAIILYEAEKLSIESMLYIKWLLDKYKWCCNKVFFCCSDESKLHPLKPLCTTVRLSPPSPQQILKILEYIGEQEGIQLSHNLVNKIILRSRNNLRQAIRSLEATCLNKDVLKDDDLILTGWEHDILNIAKLILQEQTPRQLYLIRRKLQSLMVHDVPPAFVYKSLVAELTTLVDASLRSGVAKLDKDYNRASEVEFETVKQMGGQNKQKESDERNNEATKRNASSYLKVEEFIAKFMSWYKNCYATENK